MANKQTGFKETGVNVEDLNLSKQTQEDDRYVLEPRGKMQITRVRFDYHTRFWDDKTKTGTPIVKFDGFDFTTGERIKYRTTSGVLYKFFIELMLKVGVQAEKDQNGDEWQIFKNAVNVGGFEQAGNVNKYLKVIPFKSE